MFTCTNFINETSLIKITGDACGIFCKMRLEKDSKILLVNNTFTNKAIFAIERHLHILGYSYHETT